MEGRDPITEAGRATPFGDGDAVALMNAVQCGILTCALDGAIQWANDSFLAMCDLDRQTAGAERRFQDLLTVPGKIYFENSVLPGLYLDGSVRQIAATLRQGEHKRLPVFFSAMLRRTAEGVADSISLAVFEAADRIRFENQLRETRNQTQHLAAIVSNSRDGIVSIARDRKVLTWNAAAVAMFGYSAEEAIGRPLDDLLVTPDSVDQIEAFLEEILSGGVPPTLIARRRRKDGRAVDVEVTWSPIFGAADHVTGVSLIYRDISERRRMEAALAARTEELRLGVAVAGIGLAQIDWPARTMRLDAAVAALLGIPSPGPLDLERVSALIRAEDRAQVEAKLAAARDPAEDGFAAFEARVDGEDGVARWLAASIQTTFAPDPVDAAKLALSSTLALTDVSARKIAEERLANVALEVSHRFKNLLSVVSAVCKMTLRYGDPATFEERLFDRLTSLAKNQDLLVNSGWANVDLETLIDAQTAQYGEGAERRFELAGPRIELNAEAAQGLGMAFHELATNAAKYGALSNESGLVSVNWTATAAQFVLAWSEAGGPPVTTPTRKGFGRTVIGTMVESSTGGEVEMTYDPSGFRWRLTAPRARVAAAPAR